MKNRSYIKNLFFSLTAVGFGLGLSRPAHALVVSNVLLSNTNVTYETGGIPNGTTVSFTIDQAGIVTIGVNCGIVNFGDTGTNVATLTSPPYSGPSTNQIFWNGLWLIGGEQARFSTSCDFSLILSTNGSNSAVVTPPTLVALNSVDIHNIAVGSSVDANGTATAPYSISYALAKTSNVSMTISNSSGTLARTLLSNAQQVSEAVSSHTFTWDGLGNNGQPVPLGVYSVLLTATDPAVSNSSAIPRTRTIVVQSLAGAASDPQKLFEDNVFVYPNPVRNGQGIFQMEAVRDGANISLKIYTITGTLVRQESFAGLPAGTINTFIWDVTNQSGNKVGRGLYYYVVREVDPQGTLQTVKKMAVLP